MDLEDTRTFFFDLDKTIWNWDEPVIGAADTIDSLREADRNVYFHTDNTLMSRESYAKKLTSMGIPAEKEDVLTSGYVIAKHLAENDVTEVYAIGESGLMEALDSEGIRVTEDADVVVAGFDRQFSYNKLKRAMEILQDGELYICSTEKTFRKSTGVQPHQGPFNLALEEFADAKLAGKPSALFRERFKEYFSYFPERSAFIGDRLADIETGNRLGMTSIAVMSGDINREMLEDATSLETPDYGLSSLHRLRRKII